MKTRTSQSGFTIIELIIYLALFAIIIGGALVGVYNLTEGSDRNQANIVIYEEGSFIGKKIENALNGADNIIQPAVGVPGTVLQVSKSGVVTEIGLTTGNIYQKTGSNPSITLDTDAITVSNLTFTNLSGQGIKANYTLTFWGVSRDFEIIKYLKQ
jgi:prepilin-type N-terminal cleavage/methylation domain-containing protein